MFEAALFAGLPTAVLRKVGEAYVRLGRDLIIQAGAHESAAEIEEDGRQRRRDHAAVFVSTPQRIDALMAEGMSYSLAVTAIAAETGIPGKALDAAWRTARARAERTARVMRDAAIRAMAIKGVSPAAIAARLKLHPKTVSRIVGIKAAAPPKPDSLPARWKQAAE